MIGCTAGPPIPSPCSPNLSPKGRTMSSTAPGTPTVKKVLVLKQDTTIRKLLSLLFSDRFCGVSSFGDIDAAEAAVKKTPYDLAVVDLPAEGDKLAWVKRLRGVAPGLPMVIVSA